MTNLLNSLGLGDGQGNVSSMRLVMLIVVIAILVPAVYAAIAAKTPLELSASNLEVLGIVLGAKCVQNQQEKDTPPQPPKTS